MKSLLLLCLPYITSFVVFSPLLSAKLMAEEEPSKVIECTFLHWDDVPEEKYFYRLDEQYHPITFRHGARAGDISLRRMAEFEVYKKRADPAEGVLDYEFVASTPIPSHIDTLILLVIAPDEKKGTGYRLVAIDDSTEFFPRAHFLFVNLTDKLINVNFADDIADVPADEMKAMPSKVVKGGGWVPCIMKRKDGTLMYGSRLFGSYAARELVLIRPAIREGLDIPRLKFISQLVPAAAGALSP